MQEGETTDHSLTQDLIERLEKIRFRWQVLDRIFDECCDDFEEFKSNFGHFCDP